MSEADKNRTTLSATDMEQAASNEPLAAYEFETLDTPVNIRVISYRKSRHDTDGVSAKAVLDGLVHAGILRDDSAKQVKKVCFESRKSKEEKTIIEITEYQDQQ